jgi:20S proteasome subunit beta 5
MRLPALLLAIITQAASDAPLELVAQLRAVQRDSPLLDSFNSNDAFADVPAVDLEAARASLGDDITRGFHGTTTVAFQYKEGTVCCVDSRASLGTFVGSSAEKIIPISKRVLGTMAGSAADCVSWLRLLSALSKLHELNTDEPLSASEAARTLGSLLRRRRGDDYGVGTMVFDSDALYYVDGEGYELKGSAFAVGSGSVYAYPALRDTDGADADAALRIAERAVATAAVRDAYSGGLLNLCVAEKGAEGWRRLLRRHAPVLLNT